MARRLSRPIRVAPELEEIMKEMSNKNELSMTQVSKEIANIVKGIKMSKTKIEREIKF